MKNSKEHILLSSLQLFLQKGFKEVTMQEIVNITGLSKGAVYHYFDSKEQVFSETIAHFFSSAMFFDYNVIPHGSLKKFYRGVIDKYRFDMEQTAALLSKPLSANVYYLVFDAMRILPDFREKQLAQQKEEFKAWKKAVALARKNKEIKTPLSDEQLALLFIYSGDGASLNFIMNNKTAKTADELKWLWDGVYDSVKTK